MPGRGRPGRRKLLRLRRRWRRQVWHWLYNPVCSDSTSGLAPQLRAVWPHLSRGRTERDSLALRVPGGLLRLWPYELLRRTKRRGLTLANILHSDQHRALKLGTLGWRRHLSSIPVCVVVLEFLSHIGWTHPVAVNFLDVAVVHVVAPLQVPGGLDEPIEHFSDNSRVFADILAFSDAWRTALVAPPKHDEGAKRSEHRAPVTCTSIDFEAPAHFGPLSGFCCN